MLCGTFPFKRKTDKELYSATSTVPIGFPEHLSESAKGLLQKILQLDPDKRPNAHEILNDSWLEITDQEKSFQTFSFKEIPKNSTQTINLEAYMAYYSDQSLPAKTEYPEAPKPIQTINDNINIITNITHINMPNSIQTDSDYSIASFKMGSQNYLLTSKTGRAHV